MKKRSKDLKKWKILIIILIVFSLFFFRGFYRLILNSAQLYKINKQKKEEINKNKKLKMELEMIKTNEYIEYSARTKLGLKKEEEIEYRFTPPKKENK
jgi:cell division protein FtsB